MICDFLKSFSREEKSRAKPADHHTRAAGSRAPREPSSIGRALATSHRGRREIEP
jgi:hypothetical protein